ncbi:MAG: ATP-binding cassette domain-containing protein [Moraxella sp.]|nr:ATP-binding cassette domain-containing protein [Moraxella sp.]
MRQQDEKFRLRQLLLSQKLVWCIAWLLGIATVLSVLGLVMLSGWFITMAGVAGVIALGSHAFNYLMPSAIIRGFAIVRTFARYGDLMVSHHAVFGLLKELRVRFFARWANLPLSVRMNRQYTQSSSETMQRLVRDIDTLDELPLRLISPWIVASLAVVVLSVLVLLVMPKALFSVVCVVATLFVALLTLKQGVRLAQDENVQLTQKKSQLLNTLPALTALLTWGRWDGQVATLLAQDKAHTTTTRQAMRLRRNHQALIQLIIAIAVVALLMVAATLFSGQIEPFTMQTLNHHTAVNPAVVLALFLGLLGLLEIVLGLVSEPLAWGRSLLAKARINALIDGKSSTQKQPLTGTPTIHLHDVSVKMPKALTSATNINGTLTPNKPVLIIGASGAGKSTLLGTLAGELDRVGGEILVNGVDIDVVDFGRSLGYLGQSVDIFDQTLADNLRLGKPSASDDELWAVLDKVGLSAWANRQPKGLDTPLGEYGMAISGGQGRRVALARLLLTPKAVLLLDEPFAGLDQHTRQTVWHSLTQMQADGHIGVLVIATHQIDDEMKAANIIKVG